MIANNIDGSSASLDLLGTVSALLADPSLYASKLKALTDTIAENKKYVELVGPASDILMLRTQANTDREVAGTDRAAAAQTLADAKAQADGIVGSAHADAAGILADAQGQANTLVAQAKAKTDESDAVLAQAKASLADVKRAEAEAKAATAAANAQVQSLAAQQAATEALQAEVAEIKAALLAKTQAFIGGL
jgi:cell division septum initiation protein DivIVA